MAEYDAILSGYVSMDRIIKINHPAKVGFTSIVNNSNNAKIFYGGCSTNIAYLLAKLKKKPLPVLRLGKDDLEDTGYYRFIKEAGVSMDAVTLVENETTSCCYLVSDPEKRHITLFYPGAMDGKYAKPLDKTLFEKSRLAVLTIGSFDDNAEFLNKCKQTGTKLVFGMKSDVEGFPPKLLEEILLYSEIIFTNEVEREEIERNYFLSCITDLFDKGNAKIIVTTLGKDGSEYFVKTENGIESGRITAAEKRPPVDTTGGGDSYIAGFLYAYLNGKDVKQCCEYGSVLSSFIIEKVGCIEGAPTPEEYLERYEEIYHEHTVSESR